VNKLLIVLLAINFTLAGSIWNEENVSVYGSPVAHKVNDIVLIKIDESNTATQKSQTDMKKNTQIEGNANLSWGQVANYLGLNQSAQDQGKAGFNAKNNFTGSGTVGRSSKLQAQLTAVVYKIESDRYFLHGTKRIIINDEEEEISIEGVVRASDLQADNSVYSSLISEVVLKIKGYGNVSSSQEKGFLSRLFDWLF